MPKEFFSILDMPIKRDMAKVEPEIGRGKHSLVSPLIKRRTEGEEIKWAVKVPLPETPLNPPFVRGEKLSEFGTRT